VTGVIAYHLGLGWAQGGLLGVGVFFTLSGYLITDILLSQRSKTGRLPLRDFWARRARRLLPALIVVLIVVCVWVTVAARTYVPGLRGDIVASGLYVSNWWYITQHTSYYAQFSPPAPLDHLWSLAVEEQFYLLWPWLLLLGLWLLRRRLFVGVILLAAAASAVMMAMLYHPGYDPTRVYEGTDTRAFGLLLGAALAMVWPSGRTRPCALAIAALDVAGLAGLAAIVVLAWRTTEYTAWMFRGGMVLLSLATVAVVAAAATEGSLVGRALGCWPLRWVGVRSYGIYLWHFPLIVLAVPPLATMGGPQAVAAVAAILVIAAFSWTFVEEPIRRGRRPLPRVRPVAVLAVGATGLAVLAGVAVVLPRLAGQRQSPAPSAANPSVKGNASGYVPSQGGSRSRKGALRVPLRTSCRSVVHIGDSTSDGLISSDYLPNPAERIPARYRAIGVEHQHMEISGGRSIVETVRNHANAYTVARRLIADGYHGCWVLALGTDDTADVAAASDVSLDQRIEKMMSVIGDQPVLWINVKTLVSHGPYSEQNMIAWNRALVAEQRHYPNMRICGWADVVRQSWFIKDGIHYSSYGYAQRAQIIADALAEAFPAASPAASPAPRSR
jgi:peptidoglycan/LPS O-acetylase OafA/YrhL